MHESAIVTVQKTEGVIQRLLVVVVVYRRCWSEVASAGYLLDQIEKTSPSQGEGVRFWVDKLIIYDNSPTPMAMPTQIDDYIDYKHNPENGGTRCAYDYALVEAIVAGQEWILLLDQDTSLPDNFLTAVNNASTSHNLDEIGVLLPSVADNGREISPSYISSFGSIVQLTKSSLTTNVLPISGLTGIASGSIIRTSALNQISKLPAKLWLDFVDHWIFQQLNLNGVKFLIVDITLQHKLSILDMSEVSRERLFSLLDGECVFVGSLGGLAKIIYPFRLLLRLVRLAIAYPQAARNMTSWLWLRSVGKC